MQIYNTPFIEHIKTEPISLITTEVVVGINFIRDIFAGFRDFFGGRSVSYEDSLSSAKQDAIAKLKEEAKKHRTDAIVGLTFNIFTIGAKNSMICVSVTGTAVKFVE